MYAHSRLPSLPKRRSVESEKLLILGETDFRGGRQRFGLLPEDRLRHLWIIGKTGGGKSTLLANLFAQDLAAGRGAALFDPHGDLVEAVLPLVPEEKTNRVLLFSPADEMYPVSFNVFREGRSCHSNVPLLTSQLISVFRKQWSDSWGPRLEHVLRNAILAVAPDPRATLLFLYRFLTDEQLREKVIPNIHDPIVRQFWTKEFPGYKGTLRSEALSPVLNKLGAFVANPIVRNIVSQERSRVDLVALMDQSALILVNLATGKVGEDAGHLLGGLLMSALQLSAMRRGRAEPPFYLYLDEFQHFVTDSIATMLSESRKFGLGLILAHQYLAQLPPALRDAILGNVGSRFIFRVGAADALVLEPEFLPPFTASDLQSLAPYQAAVRVLARGRELAAFSARALPGPQRSESCGRTKRIKEQSRNRFCQPRELVESAITRAIEESK